MLTQIIPINKYWFSLKAIDVAFKLYLISVMLFVWRNFSL